MATGSPTANPAQRRRKPGLRPNGHCHSRRQCPELGRLTTFPATFDHYHSTRLVRRGVYVHKIQAHHTNRVFKSVHKPHTYSGVERKLFYFDCVGAVGAFDLFNSIRRGSPCSSVVLPWSLGNGQRSLTPRRRSEKAVDFVIQVERQPGRRILREVLVLHGYDRDAKRLLIEPVFEVKHATR